MSGIILGLLTIGAGLRLAMRASAIAAGPAVQGRVTDNGNVIGEITADGTGFLILAGGAMGLVGALLYLAVRPWLPETGWGRRLAFAALLVPLIGQFLVEPHNGDFARLEPRLLNVVMFGLLALPYALLLPAVADRLTRLRPPRAIVVLSAVAGWLALLLPTALIGLGGGLLLGLALVVITTATVVITRGQAPAWWRTRARGLLGQVLLTALAVAVWIKLVGNALEILQV